MWVAKINGVCHAGGVDLALHCDVTIASDRARFRVPELLRGLPDPHMSARLVAAVGPRPGPLPDLHRGRDRRGHGGRPWAWSATSCPTTSSTSGWSGLLDQIRATGPAARAALKRDINRRLPPADLDTVSRRCRAEMTEGMASFVEKRPPRWAEG